ncbi:ribbon-helix-helix protein, CopG family [Aerococcaceae bacterium zg-ZJ1578]|uniref:ribbon-helix-helix domain-containing protein n=1 Tax=Aerococcaceae bacterium zg-252 TaxID=2796928 RepID=UPI001A183241|nr:ribbon-helix-helix protein, CopG family [Aerococcaceae bacterium zg-1578]
MAEEVKKRVQVTLSKTTVNELEQKSKEGGLSKSLIIEVALIEYFRKEKLIQSEK